VVVPRSVGKRNITHRSGVATQIKTPVLGNIQRPEQLLCKRSKSITSQIVATGGGRSNPHTDLAIGVLQTPLIETAPTGFYCLAR